MNKILLTVFVCLSVVSAKSQRNVSTDVIGTPMVGLHYSAMLPFADMKDRYGFLNQLGATAGYKDKKNWVYGVEGNFYFGNRVKNDSIFNFMTDNLGNISEAEGQFAVVQILSRGFNINAHVGKIIPIFGSNPNSGLYLSFGAGYTLMKYRIQTTYDFVPILEADNRRLYDRQTVGLSLSQFIGFSQISVNRSIHFYGGIYANQGFTRFSRSWFYDQGPAPEGILMDFQIGLRGGWYIPIYKRKAKKIYFD
jgi:hypothetical protein